jgi:xylono-1,5-lactonase
MVATSEPVCVWNVPTALGEGPLWSARDGVLWFVDIRENRLHRYAPASGEKKSYDTPPNPGFIVQHRNGDYIVGLQAGLHRFDPATGAFSLLHAIEPDKPGNRLNDGYLDSEGRLWFGSMDNGEREPTGALYRLDRDGLKKLEDGIAITNGPALSPDGRTFYHAESTAQTIYAYDVAANGDLSNKRVFVRYKDDYPDGSVVDGQGCLWNAVWGGWCVRRFAPDGKLVATVRLPCANVTKIAFAGPDLRTVYVTTARKGLSAGELADQPLAGGLFRFQSDVAGLDG